MKPLVGESFDHCKKWLWELIHTSQKNIDELIQIKRTTRHAPIKDLAQMVIEFERQSIKDTYSDLKALQRWFKASKLDPNEPLTRELKYGTRK